MARKHLHGKPIPKSKRIKNNPHAIKGRKIGAFEGGVTVSKVNGDGTITRYAIDEHGRRTELEPEDHGEQGGGLPRLRP